MNLKFFIPTIIETVVNANLLFYSLKRDFSNVQIFSFKVFH
jgi:hypothetical protein